jgi:hypothetical protein
MKKKLCFIVAALLLLVLSLNFGILFADNPWEYDPDPPQPSAPDLIACTEILPGGWTRGSVEIICVPQYVCPTCFCTPEACGHVAE